MSKEEFPSLPEQGKNLAKFTFEVVKNVIDLTPSKPVLASEEIQKDRMETCKKCDFYSYKQNRCRQCGCFLDHKVKFSVSTCPIDKWAN